MKNHLDRNLVESLSESSKSEFSEKINEVVCSVVSDALNELCEKSPLVRMDKCLLMPVNETYMGAFSQLSEYTYFLGVDNVQIELNSTVKKNWFKYIWKEFKTAWRMRKNKPKKKKKNEIEEIKHDFEPSKYRIIDLKSDLASKIANYVTESSLVTEKQDRITIIGNDDFGVGVRVNIYVCCYDSNKNIFKIYDQPHNKFINIDFGKRFENLDNLIQKHGQEFVDLAKVFNAIFSKKYDKIPSQIMIESLLFNCPEKLFVGDLYQSFLNVTNYIRVKSPKSFMSICNPEISMYDDNIFLLSNGQIDFSRLMNALDDFQF